MARWAIPRGTLQALLRALCTASGDIYTKAFTALNEWMRTCKLINHLAPKAFWGGRGVGDATKYKETMGSEHKGGVVFDYWVSNPWHGRDSLPTTTADDTSKAPMATATATRQEEREVYGDAVGNDDISTDLAEHHSSEEAYTQTSVDDWDDASLGLRRIL